MKKFTSLALALLLVVSLFAFAACGNKTDDTTIVVGASSTPHAEILEQVKETLAEQGYTLEIRVFDDYILPNKALTDGDNLTEDEKAALEETDKAIDELVEKLNKLLDK